MDEIKFDKRNYRKHDKKIRKFIEPMKQPYPKNSEDDWRKIDRSQFKKKSKEQS